MGIFRLCLRDSERPSWCSGRWSKGRWWWLLMRTHVGAGLWASSNAGVRLKEPPQFLPLDSSKFSSIQWLSCVWLFQTPWTAAHQASLSITNSWSLLKLMTIDWIGDAIQPSPPLLSLSPPAFNHSQHQGSHALYSPWNSLGQNAGVGSLSLLQGIFPTQGSNPGLPHCRRILYQLSHKGSLGYSLS